MEKREKMSKHFFKITNIISLLTETHIKECINDDLIINCNKLLD